MNNNLNNNYNFDPVTGQQINQQQPMQNQNTTNMYSQSMQSVQPTINMYQQQPVQPQQPKKKNKVFIIISIIAVIGIIVGILLFYNQDKKNLTNNETSNNSKVENNSSIVITTKFDADVHILSTEEGGRQTPFFDGFRPKFNFRSTDITGVVDLPDNIEMVNPGENISFTVTLESNVDMKVGTEFSIREGGRIIGKGTVTKVY